MSVSTSRRLFAGLEAIAGTGCAAAIGTLQQRQASAATRYLLTLLSQICYRYHLMVQRGAWSNSSNAAPHRHTSSLQSLRSHSQNSIVFGTALHPRARDRTSSIPPAFHIEIGSTSCRERVCQYV